MGQIVLLIIVAQSSPLAALGLAVLCATYHLLGHR